MATMAFNKYFYENIPVDSDKEGIYYNTLEKGAMFDARCFNIPKEEVANLIYWRQLDATRNSIQMVGQANFSQKELHGKSCNKIQDMLMLEKDINWNDFPAYQKRGSCCIKEEYAYPDEFMQTQQWRTRWIIDKDIPIFKGEDRGYIERFIYVGE
jgi:tRNA(His) 5'-end guanylyltransferase